MWTNTYNPKNKKHENTSNNNVWKHSNNRNTNKETQKYTQTKNTPKAENELQQIQTNTIQEHSKIQKKLQMANNTPINKQQITPISHQTNHKVDFI